MYWLKTLYPRFASYCEYRISSYQGFTQEQLKKERKKERKNWAQEARPCAAKRNTATRLSDQIPVIFNRMQHNLLELPFVESLCVP